MMEITYIFLAITILFALLIELRSLFDLKICALCAAISTTWIVLLVMLYVGIFNNPILLGILMGGSIVGAMYLLEQKLSEKIPDF